MGNYQTNLKIDQYFEEPLVHDLTYGPIEVIIHLDPPAVRKDDSKVDRVKLRFKSDSDVGSKMEIINSWCATELSNDNIKTEKYIHWSPKSHMRDFEVICDTAGDIKIARGQGIGVIIIDKLASYMKLMYNRRTEHGISIPACTIWHHGEKCKKLLAADLSLGYAVLFVGKNQTDHLCEKMDERDEKETMIIFQSLKPYAKYDHNKKKIKVSTVPLTESEQKFIQAYLGVVKSSVDEGGIYPHIVISKTDKEKLMIGYIDMNDMKDVWRQLMKIWKHVTDSGKVVEMIFGVDRTAKPGQGTLYDDCLPFIYANRTNGELKLKVGVINYDVKRIGTKIDPVDEKIDWDNPLWTSRLIKEWTEMNKIF